MRVRRAPYSHTSPFTSLPSDFLCLPKRAARHSTLYAPPMDRLLLDHAKNQIFDDQTNQNNGQEAGEYVRNVERVLVLEDEPPKSARSGADAEYEFGRDQGSPSEGPADFQTGEYAGEGCRHQYLRNECGSCQAVVSAYHFQSLAHGQKAGVSVQGDRPGHRMHQHEDQASVS